MRHLQEYVSDYVRRLSGPDWENACHSLVEAGPAALPYVIQAYNATADPNVKRALAQVVCEGLARSDGRDGRTSRVPVAEIATRSATAGLTHQR